MIRKKACRPFEWGKAHGFAYSHHAIGWGLVHPFWRLPYVRKYKPFTTCTSQQSNHSHTSVSCWFLLPTPQICQVIVDLDLGSYSDPNHHWHHHYHPQLKGTPKSSKRALSARLSLSTCCGLPTVPSSKAMVCRSQFWVSWEYSVWCNHVPWIARK